MSAMNSSFSMAPSEYANRRDAVLPVAAQVRHVGADLVGLAAEVLVLEDSHLAAEYLDRGDAIVESSRQRAIGGAAGSAEILPAEVGVFVKTRPLLRDRLIAAPDRHAIAAPARALASVSARTFMPVAAVIAAVADVDRRDLIVPAFALEI